MGKILTAIKLLHNDRNAFLAQCVQSMSFLFSDKKYLDLTFKYRLGYRINWENPTTFNEKLNWLKLYDRHPLYTKLVDKYEVKKYVASQVGETYIIRTIGVWNNVDEIDWLKLPNQFVLKTTHGGGNSGVIVCKDKSQLDIEKTKKRLNLALKQDLYKDSREWPYKNVPKRIIAEEFIEDDVTKELRDYKFFCFDGKVEFLFVGSGRQRPGEDVRFDFYDKDYNHLILKQGHPNSNVLPEKPSCFEEMKVIASKLSQGIPHVRIDLYEANGHVFFGEMTFYHFGGVVPFVPAKWDKVFGSYINLPGKFVDNSTT